MGFSEEQWEQVELGTLADLGWKPTPGTAIAPGTGERLTWDELVIPARLSEAMRSLNPTVPAPYLEQAFAEITTPRSNDAITENHRLHTYLVNGYRRVSYLYADGVEQHPTIRLVSAEPSENDWLAVNQVRLVSGDHHRRFDVVLYLNGLPLPAGQAAGRHQAGDGADWSRWRPATPRGVDATCGERVGGAG